MEVPENWIQSQTSPDFFLITCTCSSEVLRTLHLPFFYLYGILLERTVFVLSLSHDDSS